MKICEAGCCYECKKYVDIRIIGKNGYYTWRICKSCLLKALKLIEGAEEVFNKLTQK